MNINARVRHFGAIAGEPMDWDCGRTVVIYDVPTPIGTYSFYTTPEYCAECDGEGDQDRDHAGEILVLGPDYPDDGGNLDSQPRIAWCGNATAAAALIHADMVARIKECFLPSNKDKTA